MGKQTLTPICRGVLKKCILVCNIFVFMSVHCIFIYLTYVNFVLLSNIVYAFHFLLAICHLHFSNYLHLLGLFAAAPFTCLRVSYLVFYFSFSWMRLSVDCLCPSDDVQRFISNFQRFQCQSQTKNLMFPPMLKFVENILFSLRVLSSIGFKKSSREYNQQNTKTLRYRPNQVSFLLFS